MAEPNFQVLFVPRQDKGGSTCLQARPYQRRKSHPKSRGGCSICKAKHVKCDESKPACDRCQRSRAPCSYDAVEVSGTRGPIIRSIKERVSEAGVSSSLSRDSSLSPFLPCPGLDQSASPYGTSGIALLHHYPTVFADLGYFGAEAPAPFINLGLSQPHLLSAMLAVSAAHLRHHTVSTTSHHIAVLYQQSLAVRRFQAALAEPLDQPGSDALLLAAMMLNVLAMSVVDDDPATSWVFSDSPDRLTWFSILLGYKPLLMATKPFHSDSTMLRWMFEASDDDERTYNGGPRPLSRVAPHWLRLCGLTPDGDTGETDLHEPLRILAEIKNLEPVTANYFLYLSFVGRLDFKFRALLSARDETATWLPGYWFGLCCRFDFWWMRNRALRDHRAIVLWLEQRGIQQREGAEGQMWAELMNDLEMASQWTPAPIMDL